MSPSLELAEREGNDMDLVEAMEYHVPKSVAPKSVDSATFIAATQLYQALENHIVLIDAVNGKKDGGTTRGKKKKGEKKPSINVWAFHTRREHAIRAQVNDESNKETYDPKHEYFDKPAIGEKKDGNGNYENDSIMPMMRDKYENDYEQIALDMINEKDILTEKKPHSYWSKFSADLKNDFITKLKKDFPKNKQIKALQLVEDEELTTDPTQQAKPEQPANTIKAQPSKKRSRGEAKADTAEPDEPDEPPAKSPGRNRSKKGAAEAEQTDKPAQAAAAKSPRSSSRKNQSREKEAEEAKEDSETDDSDDDANDDEMFRQRLIQRQKRGAA